MVAAAPARAGGGLTQAARLALAVTVAVETPIVAWLYRAPIGRPGRMAGTAAVLTAITNLVMNTVWLARAGSESAFLIGGELGATVIEALVYVVVDPRRDLGRAVLTSALANSASFAAGWLVF